MRRTLAAIGMTMAFATAAAAAPRFRASIDDHWRYAPAPQEQAEAAGFDDSSWTVVDLPHTWNAADAFDKARPYRRGAGWYRKSLTLDPALRDKRLFLLFEGANQVADVYVNGRHAGQHIGGYTAFVFEITDLLTFNGPEAIAVRVDNSPDPDIPPLDADFTFYGGIYRDVWLIATSSVHLDMTDASPGVFISTPAVSEERGTVSIRGEIVNQSRRAAAVRIVSRVFDENGKVVASATLNDRIGSTWSFEQTATVDHPHLWSPSDPFLYRVRTEVFEGDDLVDAVENPFGFRWFSVDPQKGFILNGRPLRLYGTNRHQDYAGLGNALTDDLHRRDVRLVKQTGFNFLRLAHYPQDPSVLDEADRAGLVLWEEIPIVNRIVADAPASTNARAFAGNCERMLVEMIRQHYNHPSVFFWGFMNEVTLQMPKPLPDHYYETVLELARHLNTVVHAADSMRKTVMALSQGELIDDHGLADVTDVLGMNLYFGWYYGAVSDLGPFLDRMHAQHPEKPLIISEYGAGSDARVHSKTPKAFDFSPEYAEEFHRGTFPQIEARPFLVASAVWNQFDFASPHRQDTRFGINNKGLFTHERTPKDVAFYYEAALRSTPVLKIAREWRDRAGSRPADRVQTIRVYSNQPQVELFVNGRSEGVKAITNRTAESNVELRPGANRVVARSGAVEDSLTIDYDDRAGGSFVAVNAGADSSYVDRAHVVWDADRAYEPGSWGYVGGASLQTHRSILGTSDDPLFQSSREGMQRYRFDVPDGAYEVTLRFAAQNDKPGERVFSVRINGEEIVHNLDLAAEAGNFTAVTRKFSTRASGGVSIDFEALTGKPSIAAIEVRRIP